MNEFSTIKDISNLNEFIVYINIENNDPNILKKYMNKVNTLIKKNFPNKRFIFLPKSADSSITISDLDGFVEQFNASFKSHVILNKQFLTNINLN